MYISIIYCIRFQLISVLPYSVSWSNRSTVVKRIHSCLLVFAMKSHVLRDVRLAGDETGELRAMIVEKRKR